MPASEDRMTDPIEAMVAELLRARAGSQRIEKLSDRYTLDIDLAERVRTAVLDARLRSGDRTVVGYKLTVLTEEQRERLGAAEAVYGCFIDGEVSNAHAEVVLRDVGRVLVEVELAFIVRDPLPAEPTAEDVIERCDVAAAIEIPASRFDPWYPKVLTLGDVVADNGVAGHLALGPRYPATRVPATASVELWKDGERLAVGGASSLTAAGLVAWLAERVKRDGRSLEPETVVSTGFLLPPVIVANAATFRASIEGLGDVTATFR